MPSSIYHLLSECLGLLERDSCLLVIPSVFVKSKKLKMQTSVIISRKSRLQLLYCRGGISLRSVDFAEQSMGIKPRVSFPACRHHQVRASFGILMAGYQDIPLDEIC